MAHPRRVREGSASLISQVARGFAGHSGVRGWGPGSWLKTYGSGCAKPSPSPVRPPGWCPHVPRRSRRSSWVRPQAPADGASSSWGSAPTCLRPPPHPPGGLGPCLVTRHPDSRRLPPIPAPTPAPRHAGRARRHPKASSGVPRADRWPASGGCPTVGAPRLAVSWLSAAACPLGPWVRGGKGRDRVSGPVRGGVTVTYRERGGYPTALVGGMGRCATARARACSLERPWAREEWRRTLGGMGLGR